MIGHPCRKWEPRLWKRRGGGGETGRRRERLVLRRWQGGVGGGGRAVATLAVAERSGSRASGRSPLVPPLKGSSLPGVLVSDPTHAPPLPPPPLSPHGSGQQMGAVGVWIQGAGGGGGGSIDVAVCAGGCSPSEVSRSGAGWGERAAHTSARLFPSRR